MPLTCPSGNTAESFKMNFGMIRSCSIKIHEELAIYMTQEERRLVRFDEVMGLLMDERKGMDNGRWRMQNRANS